MATMANRSANARDPRDARRERLTGIASLRTPYGAPWVRRVAASRGLGGRHRRMSRPASVTHVSSAGDRAALSASPLRLRRAWALGYREVLHELDDPVRVVDHVVAVHQHGHPALVAQLLHLVAVTLAQRHAHLGEVDVGRTQLARHTA